MDTVSTTDISSITVSIVAGVKCGKETLGLLCFQCVRIWKKKDGAEQGREVKRREESEELRCQLIHKGKKTERIDDDNLYWYAATNA